MVIDKQTCIEKGCGEKIKAKGRCRRHYNRWVAVRPDGKPCCIEGCKHVAVTKGLCQIHYSRMKYNTRKIKSCSIEGCDKPLWAKGRCKKHWDEVRGEPVAPKISTLREDMGMAIDMEKIKDILSTGDVAQICNVTPRTVGKWIDSGLLEGFKIPGSLDRRCTKEQLIRFMVANKLPMYVRAKKSAVMIGFEKDMADITKKLAEEEYGISVHLANDPFQVGVLVGEIKPTAILVDGSDIENKMPMIKAMDATTADVIVVTNDRANFDGLEVHFIPSPCKVKDLVLAIGKFI
jgi:hypothetical protein